MSDRFGQLAHPLRQSKRSRSKTSNRICASRKQQQRQLLLESLESRHLLTTITGTIGFDINADAELEEHEPGIDGWTVYIDSNENNRKDDGEPTTTTDDDGAYGFQNLAAGTHRVAVESRGWQRTLPKDEPTKLVVVTADEGQTGIDFGYKPPASAPTPGNVLVTKGHFSKSDLLLEYTPEGDLVQSWLIPGTDGFSRIIAKDVEVDYEGQAHIFTGYDDVRLNTLAADGKSFSTRDVSNWDMGRTDTQWGDLAAFDHFLFANEHKDNSGAADGVIRFNLKDGSVTRFASDDIGIPRDMTIGLDGVLYVVNGNSQSTQIKAFDPVPMTFLRQVDLNYGVRSIAVDKLGQFFVTTDTGLRHLDSNGNQIKSTIQAGGHDIDLSSDGKHLVLSDTFQFTVVSRDFTNPERTALPYNTTGFGFATFVQPPVTRTEITAGLEHYWAFDEAQGTIAEDQIQGNHASLVNFESQQDRFVPGIWGNAIRFSDAEQYAITARAIPTEGSFSISFWAAVEKRIGDGHTVLMTPTSERWVSNNRNTGGGIGIGDVRGASPNLRIWENYVITVDRDTDTVKVYRDGELVDSDELELNAPNDKWVFGHHQTVTNHSRSFVGMIDDARIYSRELTNIEAEILARRPNQPEIEAMLVTEAQRFGSQPTGRFDTKTIRAFVDPNRHDWVAWNMFPDLRAMVADRDGEYHLGAYTTGVDDQITLIVTDPNGKELTAVLDKNGVLGEPSGNQSVIFGAPGTTTDVVRSDNVGSPRIFDEGGSHQQIFTLAGEYKFDFLFENIGGEASYPDVYLLFHRGAEIAGSVFHDVDRSNDQGHAEPPLGQWDVFVDVNNDGEHQSWEPITTTDRTGSYRFEALTTGNHTVRLLPKEGWEITLASRDAHTLIDQPAVGIDLGAYRIPVPLTDGNAIVSKGGFIGPDLLLEYRLDGELIQGIPIPGTEAFSRLVSKDLIVDGDGNVQVFHGYDDVRLTTYNTTNFEFSTTNVPGWDMTRTQNSFGDIAAFEDYLFANDHMDGGDDEGIIRFDIEAGGFERFDLGEVHDLTIGNDGNLYLMYPAGNQTRIDVYNPKSMEKEREVTVDIVLKSLSVDGLGEFFALATTGLRHYDRDGTLVKSSLINGDDVEISENDQSILVTNSQVVKVTSTALVTPFEIPLPNQHSGFGFSAFVQSPPNDRPNLTIVFESDELDENGGTIKAHVERPGTEGQSVVQLAVSDTSQARLPVAQVTIPDGETKSPTFEIYAIDDDKLEGDQLHTLTAKSPDLDIGAARFTILDHEALTLNLDATTMSENGGEINATVTRTDPTGELTVSILISDDSELIVPATVSFEDQETVSASFKIEAKDDDLLDGTQSVVVSVESSGYITAEETVEVTDFETLTVTADPTTISENGGSTEVTITRSVTEGDLKVTLTSLDATELSVASEVTIADGESSATVTVDAVDDATKDGTQTAQIKTEAAGYVDSTVDIDVTDHETLVLTLETTQIKELYRTTATLSRSNSDDDEPLVVAIVNGDASELILPSALNIPSTRSSVQFEVIARFDAFADGDQSAKITAKATGIEDTEVTVEILDNPHPYHNEDNPFNVDNDINDLVSPVDVLQLVNDLNSNGIRSLTNPTEPPTIFLDVNKDQVASPQDALLVINFLNRPPDSEGELESTPATSVFVPGRPPEPFDVAFEQWSVEAEDIVEADWVVDQRVGPQLKSEPSDFDDLW